MVVQLIQQWLSPHGKAKDPGIVQPTFIVFIDVPLVPESILDPKEEVFNSSEVMLWQQERWICY